KININGDLTNSIFAAGVNPVDGIINNGNDVFLSPSVIQHTRVKGTTTNSFFLASSVDVKADHGHHNTRHEDNGNHNGSGAAGASADHNSGNAHKASTAKVKVSLGGVKHAPKHHRS